MTDHLSKENDLARRAFFTWNDLFVEVCSAHGNKAVAKAIGYSEQYVSDLRRGMRKPSVEITTRLCEWLGRGPQGTRDWHRAGARAHGWLV